MDFYILPVELDEDEDIWDWEYNDDSMAGLVQPKDNFAIPAAPDNDEGVSFIFYNAKLQNKFSLKICSAVGEANSRLVTP